MKEKEKKDNPLEMNTPLEYIGCGFFIMVFGGGVVALLFLRSEQITFEFFMWATWGVYCFIGGPFILKGVFDLIDAFRKEDYLPVPLNFFTVLHYALVAARIWGKLSTLICGVILVVAVFIYRSIVMFLPSSKDKN